MAEWNSAEFRRGFRQQRPRAAQLAVTARRRDPRGRALLEQPVPEQHARERTLKTIQRARRELSDCARAITAATPSGASPRAANSYA